jgi:hypothetical protein
MKTSSHVYPSKDGSVPTFAVQLTEQSKGSYMIWAGVTDAVIAAEGGAADVALSPGRLGADWAVAMPNARFLET